MVSFQIRNRRGQYQYVDVTSYSQFFFGSKLATWTPARLLKNNTVLNVSEVVNSEIAWFKDPNLFFASGVTQQKSSNKELKELVQSYIYLRDYETAESKNVRLTVASGFGERGRRHFGEVTAQLVPKAEKILGEWVIK